MQYFGSFGKCRSEALKLLEPILEAALEAHQSGNYLDYIRHITQELSKRVTEKKFLKACREIQPELGTLIGKSFLGSLNKRGNPMLIYSAQYSGTTDDVLITVVFKNKTKPPKIDWLWVQ